VRYSDDQLMLIRERTTASVEDNAAVVLPLIDDLEECRALAKKHVGQHIDQLIEIRKQYGEWLFHLGRFGITSERHSKDTAMYLRRIANKLEGSATAKQLREVASVVPSSILREDSDPLRKLVERLLEDIAYLERSYGPSLWTTGAGYALQPRILELRAEMEQSAVKAEGPNGGS
jgi:hypothetical protein